MFILNNNEDYTKKSSAKRKKKSLIKKFFAIVFTMVGSFMLLVFLAAMAYNLVVEKDMDNNLEQQQEQKPLQEETPKEKESENESEPEPEPEPEVPEKRITVAVFGVDKEGYRTDVCFVATFDPMTKQTAILSVPRDTKVKLVPEIIQGLEERNRYIPYKDGVKGICKLTEVAAYAGEGYRNEYPVLQLEDLLDINIDYYVKVNTDGFKEIVDIVGGVDMDIKDRLYYSDPVQGLYIDIQPGFQHLDGNKAEQVVRFREGYAQKDLKRIQVQQDFMKELIKKVANTDTIISNLPKYVYAAFKYVDTDINVSDALKYIKYINDIDVNNVIMETIPGEGGAYFTADKEGIKEAVDRIFYGKQTEVPESEENQKVTAKNTDLKIEISNGGETKGLAAAKKKELEKAGYTIDFISTYGGEKQENTRIVVLQPDDGTELASYFENSVIEVNDKLVTPGMDVKVILGLNEE